MNHQENWLEVEVISTRDLTPSVREFRLAYAAPMTASPGAHVNVVAGLDSQVIRSYSVVASDDNGVVTIAVKLLENSRGGSRFMWSLKPRDRLLATAPRSAFELSYGAPSYLLLAGGIGVTPLVTMAQALLRRKANVRMVYAARNEAEFAYGSELKQMLGDKLVLLADERGGKIDIAAEVSALPQDGELYMCGPIGLMEAVQKEWARHNRPVSRLRFETFGASGRLAEKAFTVAIPRLGLEVQVPQNSSMLDALLSAGVGVLSECRRGECGLCALDVVQASSSIDHRDVFFSQEQHRENRKMCACVSRADGGTIVIETAWRGDPDLRTTEVWTAPGAACQTISGS